MFDVVGVNLNPILSRVGAPMWGARANPVHNLLHLFFRRVVILVLLDEMRKPLEDLKHRIQEIGDSL